MPEIESKSGLREVQIYEFFLKNDFSQPSKVSLNADFEGNYLTIRKAGINANLIEKIHFYDFIGIELAPKVLKIHTTLFQKPGCCSKIKPEEFRILKTINLFTRLPVYEPRFYDPKKQSQLPKFTSIIKDLIMEGFNLFLSPEYKSAALTGYKIPLQNSWQKKALVIINPISGAGKSMDLLTQNRT